MPGLRSRAAEVEEVGLQSSPRGVAVATQVEWPGLLCRLESHRGGCFFEPPGMLNQSRKLTSQHLFYQNYLYGKLGHIFLVFSYTNETVFVVQVILEIHLHGQGVKYCRKRVKSQFPFIFLTYFSTDSTLGKNCLQLELHTQSFFCVLIYICTNIYTQF